MELLQTQFTSELLFLLHVAKILQSELQFCEQMCTPSFSFLFGSLATSPRKNGAHSLIHTFTHSTTNYLANVVSELGEEKGGVIHG